MLFLLFQLGKDRYALEASRVVEVLPMVARKHLPQAPRVCRYFQLSRTTGAGRGSLRVGNGKAAEDRFSTRIIIVNYQTSGHAVRLLGLIAESATECCARTPRPLFQSGVHLPAAPYLGPILMDVQGPIQWIDEQRLLPEDVCESLFAQTLGLSPELDCKAKPQ